MALPFSDNETKKKRDQVVAIDLGSRTTKAVHLVRRGTGFALCRFALLDAPIFEKTLSAELLTEHLRAVSQALDAKTKSVALTMSVNDALVRHVDMPRMSVDDMRQVLKLSSRNYLQQDLPGHIFDCHVLAQANSATATEPGKTQGGQPKQKVLVTGAKKQLIDDYVAGAKGAGLSADHIVPGLIGPANAFELAQPEVFANEVVALVDMGFKSTSICILQQGELILSRVVGIGGDRLTNAISESMNISYAEAEGIKVGMAGEVQSTIESVLLPLGRELRASIDFFEHQQDRPVASVFLSGGSVRSDLVLQTLKSELLIECQTWNPTSFLQMDLPPAQVADMEQVSSQLAVAVGAAIAAL
jgi:type IV pilus assembly protein PilM